MPAASVRPGRTGIETDEAVARPEPRRAAGHRGPRSARSAVNSCRRPGAARCPDAHRDARAAGVLPPEHPSGQVTATEAGEFAATGSARRRAGVGLGAAFLFAALNLRPSIAAVSPLLSRIRSSDHLSPVEAGLLTSMPLVCFGIVALVAPRVVRRIGSGALLLACLSGLVVSIALRSLPPVSTLYIGTFGIGVTIAVANVLMPGVVKKDFPERVALMTGLYTMMLSLGPSVGATLSIPLDHLLGGSWRGALGLFALPAAAALACWLPFRRHDLAPEGGGARTGPDRRRQLWRHPLAWSISFYMGLQSLNFYTVLAWLPTILQRRGLSPGGAGSLLGLVNLIAIAASLTAPWLSERLGSQRIPVLLSAGANAGGLAGLVLDGHHLQLLWAALIGLGQGSAVSLAFMMMVVRAADPEEATALSGMAQGVGYVLAAAGPVAAGALFAGLRSWDAPLVGLAVLLVVQTAVGWHAGKAGGDPLPAASGSR